MLSYRRTPQMRAAVRTGRQARVDGRKRTDCPYVDWRGVNGRDATWSRAWRNAWFEGWDGGPEDVRKEGAIS
jgi:ribosome modulation factor